MHFHHLDRGGMVAGIFGTAAILKQLTLGMAVAVALDLIHALTPGHGKAVISSHSHAPAER